MSVTTGLVRVNVHTRTIVFKVRIPRRIWRIRPCLALFIRHISRKKRTSGPRLCTAKVVVNSKILLQNYYQVGQNRMDADGYRDGALIPGDRCCSRYSYYRSPEYTCV